MSVEKGGEGGMWILVDLGVPKELIHSYSHAHTRTHSLPQTTLYPHSPALHIHNHPIPHSHSQTHTHHTPYSHIHIHHTLYTHIHTQKKNR